MRRITAIAHAFAFCLTISSVFAGECSNPNALGTSRTLVIDNTSHPRLGAQQYSETLPLADHEVVLTFDDGPLGPYTTRILDLLAADCVKATYFLVGTMAQSNPALVQRIQREGHTIGTHSRSHPLTFDSMPLPNAEREIDDGITLVKAALGEQGQVAPFFRIPGLLRSSPVESALASRSLVTWSVDLVADDWYRHITADEIAKRALRRLDERGRGILLLHDIHPATALAMPAILKGLKARGFRIVHVVPAAPGRPKTYSEPQQWAAHGRAPRIVVADGRIDPRLPVPSRVSLGADYVAGTKSIAVFAPPADVRHVMAAAGDEPRLPGGVWPEEDRAVMSENIAPSAPGAGAIDWPQGDHIAAIVSFEEAIWPAAKPARIAEPPIAEPKEPREPRKRSAASRGRLKNPAGSCRDGETNVANPAPRCKPRVGHQLSLTTGTISPESVRSQYAF
jgi:peptidoglycan/xylan/chitin deacetylase (PgdA/CDA1 family)